MALLRIFCVVCLAIAIVFSWLYVDNANTLDRMRQINGAASDLLISLLDAETGQRGYVITDNDGYLDPYRAGVASIDARRKAVAVALGSSVEPRIAQDLNALVRLKLDELDRTIQLRRISFAAAAAEVNRHLGKNIMDQIRMDLSEIDLTAAERYDNAQARAITFFRIGLVGMLAAFVSLGVVLGRS